MIRFPLTYTPNKPFTSPSLLATHHIVDDLHPGTLNDSRVSRYSGVGTLNVDVVAVTGCVVPNRSRVPGWGPASHSRPVERVVLYRLGGRGFRGDSGERGN